VDQVHSIPVLKGFFAQRVGVTQTMGTVSGCANRRGPRQPGEPPKRGHTRQNDASAKYYEYKAAAVYDP
jgi:hypothetical protein